MWGKGSPPFAGRTITVPETVCYPRPLQERIPILVGGSDERRTLALVARHADACNLFGGGATVRQKLSMLDRHCAAIGRDRAQITVTHLAPARVVASADARAGQGAATAEEHVGRYRELREAGVQTAIVALSDADAPDAVRRFAEVIEAFSARPGARAPA
jgi:alkanesulfonate monooxygenase SsuD/methylene tetrahydromethanopterin reductase-like flavin-dependent oxidoreductase (luciferase family)